MFCAFSSLTSTMQVIFLLLMIKLICCYQMPFIHHPELSNVSVSHRVNYVLIAISGNISRKNFDTLFSRYINLEKEALKNAAKNNVEWTTYISFGGISLSKIQKENDLDAILNVSKICEKSIATSFYKIVTVFESFNKKNIKDNRIQKEYALVVSDFCDGYMFLEVSRAAYRRNHFSQEGLMIFCNTTQILGFNRDANKILWCASYLDIDYKRNKYPVFGLTEPPIFYDNSPPKYIHIFTQEYNSSDINRYTDMEITYYSTPETAFVNLFVLANDIFKTPYHFVKSDVFSNCLGKNGSFYAYYRNKKEDLCVKMGLPLYFNENNSSQDFLKNYEKHMNNSKLDNEIPNKCHNFHNFLSTLSTYWRKNVEQYNILILEDPYPSCMNFDIQWKTTNRTLNIIVLYSGKVQSNYSNFFGAKIDFLTYNYANDMNFSKIEGICQTHVKQEEEKIPITFLYSTASQFHDPRNETLKLHEPQRETKLPSIPIACVVFGITLLWLIFVISLLYFFWMYKKTVQRHRNFVKLADRKNEKSSLLNNNEIAIQIATNDDSDTTVENKGNST